MTGFMGSGKTTVGIRLSYRLRQQLVDTDRLIERKRGRSISEIFAGQEEGFRRMEAALRSLLETEGEQIISTGGGLPMREENRMLLKELGTVVFLRVSAETVYERLKGDDTRPLLQKENPMEEIRRLLEIRNPVYQAAADITVDVDGKDFEEIIGEIAGIAGGEKETADENTCD
ncbi:MAG: shikimate kinase [Eisenbergiella sp.]